METDTKSGIKAPKRQSAFSATSLSTMNNTALVVGIIEAIQAMSTDSAT
jgi:hypothetical protein